MNDMITALFDVHNGPSERGLKTDILGHNKMGSLS